MSEKENQLSSLFRTEEPPQNSGPQLTIDMLHKARIEIHRMGDAAQEIVEFNCSECGMTQCELNYRMGPRLLIAGRLCDQCYAKSIGL